MFLLSLALFMLATLGAGNADSIGALIGWRTLQGMGGGLLIPIGQTLTYQLYRSHERAGLSAAIMLVGCWRRRCHRRWVAGSSIGWTGAGSFRQPAAGGRGPGAGGPVAARGNVDGDA